MLCVIYRNKQGLNILNREFEDVEDAEAMAEILRHGVSTDVTVMIDLETADETARAMSFTALPIRGQVHSPTATA